MRYIIPLAAILTFPFTDIAKADGCEPGTKCYRQMMQFSAPAPRAYPYIKQVSSKPWCPFAGRNMTREACREIERIERRRERRGYREDRTEYDGDRDRPRGKCGDVIAGNGKKIWSIIGPEQAKNEAVLQWQRDVVSKDYSERYADPSYARKVGDGPYGPGFSCWKSGRSYRCTFTARPCKA